MQITDRSKDVIKSGGEWISSIDLENLAVGHPAVAEAAVIGVYHPKWDERPLLIVQLKQGQSATREDILKFMDGKIAKWWMPDDVVFVDGIPHTATGKILKTALRDRFQELPFPERGGVRAERPFHPSPAGRDGAHRTARNSPSSEHHKLDAAIADFRPAEEHPLLPDDQHQLGRVAQVVADAFCDRPVDAGFRVGHHIELFDRPTLQVQGRWRCRATSGPAASGSARAGRLSGIGQIDLRLGQDCRNASADDR